MPKAGDTIRYSTAVTLGGTSLSKTGANQTWDYTDLSPISQGLEEFVYSYQTPYLLNFGFSALGLKLADTLGTAEFQLKNVYNFYRNSSSTFTDVGLGFQFGAFPLPQSGKHSDPDEIYTFPLKFGNSDTTTFSVKVPIMVTIVPVGNFYRSGTRINEVDGWGKISTPYASGVSCLRIKSTITEYDSISIPTLSLGFGIETTRIEYKWLSTSERFPMLTVTGNDDFGTFVPANIRYRDSTRTIGPPETVEADFEVDKTFTSKGQVLNFTNLSNGNNLSYSWDIQPSASVLFVNGTSSTSEHPRVVINDSGYFSVRLIAAGRANRDTMLKEDYVRISFSSGLEDFNEEGVSVYPNPARDQLHVDLPKDGRIYQMQIIDVTGLIVVNKLSGSNMLIHTSAMASGPYFVTIIDDKNRTIFRNVLLIED